MDGTPLVCNPMFTLTGDTVSAVPPTIFSSGENRWNDSAAVAAFRPDRVSAPNQIQADSWPSNSRRKNE